MPSVVVTHVDSSITTYANCMAGVSNNQGSGWKLSVIPTDSSQPPFVVDLRSGESYQEVSSLPTAATFAGPSQAAASAPELTVPVTPDDAVAADATLLADVLPAGTKDTIQAPAGVPDSTL